MRLARWIGAGALALTAVVAQAQAPAPTQLTLQYPYGSAFKPIFDTLIERFQATHPAIRVVTRPPFQNYEDALEKTLRGAITGDLADVSLQGINRQRDLIERKIAQPLTRFMRAESKWEQQGYTGAIMEVGRFGGQLYSLPVGVSTPIVYFNADLVRKAGGDPNNFPHDWNAILALASRINALGNDVSGISYAWDVTGNWMWQALIMSHGGTMMSADEKKITFGDAAGRSSIRLLSRMVKEGGMRNLKLASAMQSFSAGKIGILISTSAYTATITKGTGDRFALRTTTFPLAAGEARARLPGGGNVAMVSAKQPEKQKAAWEFLKFIASPESSAFVARSTGYAPVNRLAAEDPKYLGDYYKGEPNHLANLRQRSLITQWYAFPGDNGLKITDVIADHLQSVVSGSVDPDTALARMVSEVGALLPR